MLTLFLHPTRVPRTQAYAYFCRSGYRGILAIVHETVPCRALCELVSISYSTFIWWCCLELASYGPFIVILDVYMLAYNNFEWIPVFHHVSTSASTSLDKAGETNEWACEAIYQ